MGNSSGTAGTSRPGCYRTAHLVPVPQGKEQGVKIDSAQTRTAVLLSLAAARVNDGMPEKGWGCAASLLAPMGAHWVRARKPPPQG